MKILAIGCTPNLYYYTSRGLKIEIDYKTTTQIFPFFLTRPKNISLGTPDMYTPNVSQYVSQFTGYDFIVVGYDMKDYPAEFLGTGGYTHSIPVNNAIWCTVRKDININSYITHEIMHSLVYYLNVILGLNKSNATMIRDCMDSDMQNRPYYLNYDPENPDSNYSQTWNQIKLHLDKLNNIKYDMKQTLTMTRLEDDGIQTLGELKYGSSTFKTLERPWKENKPNISCIPKGTYNVKYSFSPKFLKWTYEIQNVPKRSGIRIHSANFFYQLLGCIALGSKIIDINKDGKKDVIDSRIAVNKLETLLSKKDFTLVIK